MSVTKLHPTQTSTGRRNPAEPEQQFFPGTPQAKALARRLKDGREATANAPIQTDVSELEMRLVKQYAERGIVRVVRNER